MFARDFCTVNSLGGPIVVPQSAVITVNPVSPHTLTARPVIVPEDSAIRVVVTAAPADVHITADGQVEGFYRAPVEFTVQKSRANIKLVKLHQQSYFDLLRKKLLWGQDLRVSARDGKPRGD